MSEPLLSIAELAVSYGQAVVLRNVSLTVQEGEVVGLVGRNGAGKTTTLNAISGVVRRQAGTLTIRGQQLPKRPEKVARLGVMQVPEGRGLMPHLTAIQNLKLGAIAVGRRFTSADLDRVLELFPGLEGTLDRPAGLLSGGQQQMVAIARGLMPKPAVLMVDELSLGLAPKVVTDLLELLTAIATKESIGLLLVDQNVRALAGVCHTMYHLDGGRSAQSDLKDEQVLRSVYFS